MSWKKLNRRAISAEVRAERASRRRGERDLARFLAHSIHQKDWSLARAAFECRLSETRMRDLLEGRVERFSFGSLVPIANVVCVGALNAPGGTNITPPNHEG
ncbi:MAG: hypothetical protein EON54_26410 [Alcaligenaceae bacterium]|nr:MAG: hypothetical protein EON54_26410 [Alcaligenaceae bacterium]